MEELILFGTGDIAQIAKYYFEKDSLYKIVAFTVDTQLIKNEQYEGKPVVPFEKIEELYPPDKFKMFIALGYSKMNKLREQKYFSAKDKGYELVSYVNPNCTFLSQHNPGENCFIFEDNTIQPYVKIGNNVFIWSGNHIGHHSNIEDHNFISSHVVISGHCTVKPYCFLGVNSTIAHKVVVATESLVGAGAVINKSTKAKGVYVPPKTNLLNRTSDKFNL